MSVHMVGSNWGSMSTVVHIHPTRSHALLKLFVPQHISRTLIYRFKVFFISAGLRTRRVMGLNLNMATAATIFARTFIQAVPRTIVATATERIHNSFWCFRINGAHLFNTSFIRRPPKKSVTIKQCSPSSPNLGQSATCSSPKKGPNRLA